MINRFVIDETSWQFDHLALGDCCDELEQLLDKIEKAIQEKHGVCYSEELFCQPVWQNKMFHELIDRNSGYAISRDTYERLFSIIYKLPKWQDLELSLPETDQVDFDGQPQTAASIAWAHQQSHADKNNAVACLVLSPKRICGKHKITVAKRTVSLWLVADWNSYQGFFRGLITDISKNPDEMAYFSESAFLNLDFRDHVFQGIKDMSKPYQALVGDIVKHLAALSDHGKEIFSGELEDASDKFRPLGVNMSPESGKTKQNKKACDQRTFSHKEKEVIFWWHSKLEPDRDRIHFYPNNVRTGGKIIIGIFCKHFNT
jgi:hypothetical protein